MPRASWNGFLRLSLVTCPVYLVPALAVVLALGLTGETRLARSPQLSPVPRQDTETRAPACGRAQLS